MKTFLAVILATIFGIALGTGIAALRIAVAPWDGNPDGVQVGSQAGSSSGGPAPKVVVEKPEHEFGLMDIQAEGKHDFIFANRGDAPLVLTEGDNSCGCTVSDIEGSSIAPGKSATVTLKWKAHEGEGPFRETAFIETNDPTRRRVTLTIWGRITRAVRPVPSELALGSISAGRPVTSQVRLLCYLEEPLGVLACEPVDQQTGEHFEVTFEPLPADQLEEAEGEQEKLDKEGNAEGKPKPGKTGKPRSGYLLEITVKPGLPLGGFRQTILVKTNQQSVPTVKIPVVGRVVGDISIYGRGWNGENNVLTLGTLSSQEEVESMLLLVTRGPHSKEIKFELDPTSPSPDLIEVDQQRLKKTTAIGSGEVTRTELVVRVKGSRRANYLGPKLGEILINTSH
ncbi:MAG: DUF1573 domain-containing protein, partial [Planctomycetota bacterium]